MMIRKEDAHKLRAKTAALDKKRSTGMGAKERKLRASFYANSRVAEATSAYSSSRRLEILEKEVKREALLATSSSKDVNRGADVVPGHQEKESEKEAEKGVDREKATEVGSFSAGLNDGDLDRQRTSSGGLDCTRGPAIPNLEEEFTSECEWVAVEDIFYYFVAANVSHLESDSNLSPLATPWSGWIDIMLVRSRMR